MGTSQAASAPTTKDWKQHVPSALRSPVHNPVTIADAVLSSTLPILLPSGLITAPLFCLTYESIRFLIAYKSGGLEKAAEEFAIRISSSYIAPSIAKSLWNTIQPQIAPEFTNSPYGKIAERAMTKTISSIIAKGVKAMEIDNNE